jgi:hypothetical protein
MRTHRFGRKLKLPSTVAIKFAIMRLMVQDELKARASATKTEGASPCSAMPLRGHSTAEGKHQGLSDRHGMYTR